jgi:outer membrane protein
MKGFRILCLCAFVIMSSSVSAQTATGGKLTLKQCIETGVANNLEVLQNELLAKGDEIDWKQAKLNRLPGLNASGNQGVNQGRSIDPFTNGYINEKVNYANFGLNSDVVVFNGMALQNSVKRDKLAMEASKMDWQQAKDNLTINIILAYLQVLSNEDLLAQAMNQADVSKKQVDRLIVMDKEGAIPPSQLSDLRGQYAGDQLSIINARNAVESSKLALCRLMNILYDKTMQLERLDAASFATTYEDTPGKIYETALQQFSLVKARDLRKQSSEKAVKAIKGELFPTLSLYGNVNSNYSSAARDAMLLNVTDAPSSDYVLVSGTPSPVIYKQSNYQYNKIGYGKQLNNNLYTSFGVSLRIPIFNSLQVRNRVKQAQLTVKNNELVLQTTKTQLQQSIEQAYVDMTSASERYKVLLEQVAAFTESFRAADIRFNSGVGTPVDYMTAKNNLDRANINLINARYDFILRTKVLDYYQGKQIDKN